MWSFKRGKKLCNGRRLFIGPKEENKEKPEQRSGDLFLRMPSIHLLSTPKTVVISQIDFSCRH